MTEVCSTCKYYMSTTRMCRLNPPIPETYHIPDDWWCGRHSSEKEEEAEPWLTYMKDAIASLKDVKQNFNSINASLGDLYSRVQQLKDELKMKQNKDLTYGE